MNQEIGGKQWPGASPFGSRPASVAGRDAEGIDVWLGRNVRACSQQEYRRYREYLEPEPVSGRESGA